MQYPLQDNLKRYQFGDILILFLKTDWIHGLEKQGQGA